MIRGGPTFCLLKQLNTPKKDKPICRYAKIHTARAILPHILMKPELCKKLSPLSVGIQRHDETKMGCNCAVCFAQGSAAALRTELGAAQLLGAARGTEPGKLHGGNGDSFWLHFKDRQAKAARVGLKSEQTNSLCEVELCVDQIVTRNLN